MEGIVGRVADGPAAHAVVHRQHIGVAAVFQRQIPVPRCLREMRRTHAAAEADVAAQVEPVFVTCALYISYFAAVGVCPAAMSHSVLAVHETLTVSLPEVGLDA